MISLNGFTAEQLADIEAEFRTGWNQRAVMAEHGRRAIAEINSEETFWRDDWRVTMRMDPLVALYWKMREGLDVWDDSGHLRYFKKHFPEVFTNQRSGKMQHGYRGGAAPRQLRNADCGMRIDRSNTNENGAGLLDRTGMPVAANPQSAI